MTILKNRSMKNLSIVVFLLFSFFACKNDRQDSSGMTMKKIYEFEISDSFIRPIKSEMTRLHSDSTYILFFQNIKTKKITSCILHKNKGIVLDHKEINIKNYYFNLFSRSEDSIFSFTNKTNQIVLKNSSGSVFNTYHINEKYIPETSPITKLAGSNGRLLLGNSNKNLNFGKLDQRIIYYKNVKPLLIVDIADSIPTCYAFAEFPEEYVLSGANYEDPCPSACFGNDGLICVSFGADDYLYLYNDSTLILRKEVKSKFIDKFNPYPDSKTFDMLYLKNYSIEEPRFLDIVYDPWENMYYRIERHRFKEKKKLENTWSVIAMDTNLNILYEKVFNFKYNPKVFVLTPFGIVMQNIGRSTNNNSVFEIFKFIKDE
jgi:hypothetical protein